MIPAGRLRHRITLQRQVVTRDEDGNTFTEWVPWVEHIPAEIVDLSARDLIAAGAKQAEVTSRIRIRYLPGVLTSMRAVDDDMGTIYTLVGIIADANSGREALTLAAKRGVSDGR